ncbi:MAG: hypothetical protein KA020_07185 [Planctomycetes bacterium]|nr:hypothetical protein [Planctomycetota bacterium]
MAYLPPNIKKVHRSVLLAFNKVEADAALSNLAATAGQLPLRAVVSWGGQVGMTRRANIELRDALDRTVTGNYAVMVWIAEEEGGGPGSSQITSIATGTSLFDLDAGFIFVAMTNEQGQLAIDIEGGSGDRWLGVVPMGGVFGSGETWT